MKVKNISKVEGRLPLRDPFIMGAYHYELYPEGNGKLGPKASLAGRNIGNDFDRSNPWRMYHGQQIPGFPHHPHRGFEIITIVSEGYADHFDSKGSKGRYGDGDVQLMSAGEGVLHAEMFPLIHEDKPNPLRLFQIWVNMAGKDKLTEPDYKMLWKEIIPEAILDQEGNKVSIKVIHGEYYGVKSLGALKHSWARDPEHHVGAALVEMDPGTAIKLDAVSKTMNRFVLYYDGQDPVEMAEYKVQPNHMADLGGDEEIWIKNTGSGIAKLLILEGEPIGEPVAAYGPFVMNTEKELQEAFNQYRRTEFGGWPWGGEEQDLVHAKDTGRFASYDFDKVIDKPEAIK